MTLAEPHPMLRPDSALDAATVQRHTGSGAWTSTTLRSLLRAAADSHPDRTAVVTRPARGRGRTLTYAEVEAEADRLAGGLRSLGVTRGTPVAVMLPNGAEFTAAIFAIAALGGVYSGIPVAYGPREAHAILATSRAEVLLVAAEHGGRPVAAVVAGLRERLPDLRHVVVAGGPPGPGAHAYSDVAGGPPLRDDAADPRALVHVGFTSGTTGAPKGVMNSSQTLTCVLRRWVAHVGAESLGSPLVNLVASPVGHHTGFVWGVLLTAALGGTAVHLERWDPVAAAAAIDEHRVTAMFGAPTFLLDLLRPDVAGTADLTSLRFVTVAGGPVPRDLPARAAGRLGAYVCPAWGMTEYAIGISAAPHLGPEVLATDGVPVEGCEVRVEHGELQIRGPGLFHGYLGIDPSAAFTADGWFRTGDTAVRDEHGRVRLTGRLKDIVIRGGENIPVTELESVLHSHPALAEVAVIGVPDPRLGERVLAVAVPATPGRPVTLEEITAHLAAAGTSRHFWPQAVELVDALPRTPSGKVRKVELRERFGA